MIDLGEISNSGNDHGGEELWIVSYADLMTLLLGFFIILFSFSNVDEKKFDSVSEQLAESLGGKKLEKDISSMNDERKIRALQLLVAMLNLGDLDKAVAKIEQAASVNTEAEGAASLLRPAEEAEIMTDIINARLRGGSKERVVRIVIPAKLVFVGGTDDLSKQAKLELNRLANELKILPNWKKVEISGHTDSRPLRPSARFGSNWALSSSRAGVVAEYLSQLGISKNKLVARGMADAEPLFSEQNADGTPNLANMDLNRRVQIEVTIGEDNVR